MTHFYTSAHLRGDSIYLRGYSNGKAFKETVDAEPYLFFPHKDGDYRTLDGSPVRKKLYSTVREAKDYLKSQEQVPNSKTYGLPYFLYTYINDNFPGTIDYDPTMIARVSIDIETMSDKGFPKPELAEHEITAVTLSHRQNGNAKRVMFGTKVYRPKMAGVSFVLCDNERDLIVKLLDFWNDPEWTPDIVTGWNVEGFDIPYLINRTRNILGDSYIKLWSPWRIVQERDIVRGKSSSTTAKGAAERTETVFEMFGITILDYMQIYKKFTFQNHESYKLDHIAFVELGERKLDYSEYGSLHNFYVMNYEGYMDYNLDDTIKIDKLDEKLKLIDLVLALAYDAKVTYQDTMTTTRPWDVIIHNYLMNDRIVVPQYRRESSDWSLIGGYVKNTVPGMYKWVVSFDLNSLYPHLIMQYNISPETLVGRHDFSGIDVIDRLGEEYEKYKEDLVKNDQIMAGNGCVYDRNKIGFLPALMLKMYNDRVVYKKLMIQAQKDYERTKDKEYEKAISRYHNLQMAKKLQLNSAYGALANEFFRWFNINNAEAVTMSGQMSTKFIETKLNGYMNKLLGTTNEDYIIAADTDSIYLHFDPLIQKVGLTDEQQIIDFIDKACTQKIEPFIDKTFQELANMSNAKFQKMVMKRETISNKGIFSAKKMYILNVWDSEGVRYSEPKLKMKGVQAVRSSTPMIVRDKIKAIYSLIMNKDEKELLAYVEKFKEEFESLNFIDIAFPRGCNNMEEYSDVSSIYRKGCPIQVRGALVYNHHIKKMGLENKYELIQSADKIKFAYLKTPNHFRESVIAVKDNLPPEFELEKYIDYETQFEKTFKDPISKITDIVGWKIEEGSGNLMDLLG